MFKIGLARWIVLVDDTHPFRAKERIVRQFAGPCLTDPAVLALSTEYYVSKQLSDIWLTLFVLPTRRAELVPLVERHATSCRPVLQPENLDEALLSADCATYRLQLTRATRYAMDLHLAENFISHQQALIGIACSSQDPRPDLAEYFERNSSNYRSESVEAKQAFWASFFEPGPCAGLSEHGHWIWNIVLGLDPFRLPRRLPEVVAGLIGIPWSGGETK